MRDKNKLQIHAGDLVQIDGDFRWFRHTSNGTISWKLKEQEPLIGLFINEKICEPYEIDVASDASYHAKGANVAIFECQILAEGRCLNVVAARKEITLLSCASREQLEVLFVNR